MEMERTGLRRSVSQDVLQGENVHLPTASKSLSSKLSSKAKALAERKPLIDKSNNTAKLTHSTKSTSSSIAVFKDVDTTTATKKDTKSNDKAAAAADTVASTTQKENGQIDEFFEDNDVRYEKEPEMLPVPVLPIIVPHHLRHLFRKTPQKRSSSDDHTNPSSSTSTSTSSSSAFFTVDNVQKKQRTKEEYPLTDRTNTKITNHNNSIATTNTNTTNTTTTTTTTTLSSSTTVLKSATTATSATSTFFDRDTPALTITESAEEALLLEKEQELRSKQAQMQTKQPIPKSNRDDPMRVAEYAQEIFQNLYETERSILADPGYAVRQQHEVTWKMRSVLIDWVIEIHYLFQLLPETLFLTVNIIDRFLSQRTVVLGKLQLVGITSLFIATKFEEMTSPTLGDFLFMTDKAVKEDELLKAERFILQVLDFRLCYPNPLNFLRRICQYDYSCDVHTRTLAKYFLEISCIDHRFIGVRPSKVASAALWLAHKMMARGRWTNELTQVSGYTAEELKPTVEAMLDYLSQPVAHQAFYKKWSSRVYSKASVFVRDWINRYYVN